MFAINLNSSININADLDEYALRNIGFLMNVWKKLPVYLVDEKLMDVLYPHEKRNILNMECLQENNNVLKNEFRIRERGFERDICYELKTVDNFWEYISRCIKESNENDFIAVGLYKRRISNQEMSIIREKSKEILIPNKPCIFLCPDRISDWALNIKKDFSKYNKNKIFKIIYAMVLYHELAHGYMDRNVNDYYIELFGKVIEESLANAISNSRFSGFPKGIVNYAMTTQPIEYSSYTFWTEYDKYLLKKIATNWAELNLLDLLLFNNSFLYKIHYNEFYFRDEIYLRDYLNEIRSNPELFWKIVAKKIIEETI